MNKNIVFPINHDLFVGTWDLAKGFEIEHRLLKDLIKKYKLEFDDFGFITFLTQRRTGKKGNQIQEYYLNEEQSTYLVMLLQNNNKVRKFKRVLTKQFHWMRRKILMQDIQIKNAEWLQKRVDGKIERRLETDVIKKFVEYATERGSQNANKYYIIISKMENTALFAFDYLHQKFPNLREMVNTRSLDVLMMADRIIARALEEGMECMMDYKEIYKLAQARVEQFGLSIGKTPIEIAIGEIPSKQIK